ncbi:MAG: hypothetical protein J2P36_31110, partial [Ktedonobacteraceae bacterium]|nr:hypothetical protein [Ktedonobacteraceae bacterium]
LTKQRRVEVHQSEVVLYTAQRDLASRNGQTTDALRFEVLRARAHRETDTSRNEADHYQLDIATLNAIERYYQHIAGIYSAQSSQATDVLEQQKFAVHAAEARYQALRSASVSLRRREYIADIRKATLDQPDWSEALEIMTEKEGIVQEQHKSSQALREAGLQRLAARGNFYRVAAERAEAEGRVEDALRYQLWAAKHHRDAYTMDLHNIVDPLQMGLLPQGEAVFRDEVEEISQRIQAMIRDRTWSRDALSEPPPRQYGRFPNNNHFHRISTVEPFKWNGELDLDSRQIPGHLFM